MASSPFGTPPLSDSDFDLSEGLGDESENTALRSLIGDEIRDQGSITFCRFMELALYHPTEGYYNAARERIGRAGDYVTSPEISPLFGYAVARQIAELWRCQSSPAQFPIVEYGAGNGRLARDVIHWMAQRDPECYRSLTYTLIEISPALRAIEGESLADLAATEKLRVGGHRQDELTSCCVIANELLDSFPVHRVAMRDGTLKEVYVNLDGDALIETLGPPSTGELPAYFSRLELLPAEGCVVEVNLAVGKWLTEAAKTVPYGYVLLLDYGYAAERLYAPWRRDGTLLCYHRHSASGDPYRFLGRQDITSHVDFSSLALDARALGFSLLGFTDQSRFLAGLGLAGQPPTRPRDENGMEEFYARRRAVEALTDTAGLGRIGVIMLGRQAPTCDFLGFREQPNRI